MGMGSGGGVGEMVGLGRGIVQIWYGETWYVGDKTNCVVCDWLPGTTKHTLHKKENPGPKEENSEDVNRLGLHTGMLRWLGAVMMIGCLV